MFISPSQVSITSSVPLQNKWAIAPVRFGDDEPSSSEPQVQVYSSYRGFEVNFALLNQMGFRAKQGLNIAFPQVEVFNESNQDDFRRFEQRLQDLVFTPRLDIDFETQSVVFVLMPESNPSAARPELKQADYNVDTQQARFIFKAPSPTVNNANLRSGHRWMLLVVDKDVIETTPPLVRIQN